jgi:hypothetical protein
MCPVVCGVCMLECESMQHCVVTRSNHNLLLLIGKMPHNFSAMILLCYWSQNMAVC